MEGKKEDRGGGDQGLNAEREEGIHFLFFPPEKVYTDVLTLLKTNGWEFQIH